MDALSRDRRSENMRRIRSKDTSPEIIVRRLVHAMGFRFRLHVTSLPGKPDIVFPRLCKIIEVQGCFWHQHPGCIDSHIPKTRRDYWKPKLLRNQARDLSNRRELRNRGWRVLVLWECHVRRGRRVTDRIERFLSS